MHHVALDRWSRQQSPLHALDPRAKLIVLALFLVVLATTPANATLPFLIDLSLLLAGILFARLPMLGVLTRAMVVLPFSLTFGLLSWMAGDAARAIVAA